MARLKFSVGGVDFWWPTALVLESKETFKRHYGNPEVSGIPQGTKDNLSRSETDSVHKGLVVELKQRLTRDKALQKEMEKTQKVETDKVRDANIKARNQRIENSKKVNG